MCSAGPIPPPSGHPIFFIFSWYSEFGHVSFEGMKRRKRSCSNCKRLEKDVKILKEMVATLVIENKKLTAENRFLRDKVKELEEKINQNSTNSSKPPSTDPPGTKPKKNKPEKGRKRGGQPGHLDQQRKIYPPDQVDSHNHWKPDRCGHCGRALQGEDPNPRLEQKVDVPPIDPIVTNHYIHTLTCECGCQTTGRLPEGVQQGTFGPQVQAIVSLLSGAFRLSKREIARIMSDVFHVEMCLGTVSNLEHATSKALEKPVEEAKQFVQEQDIAFADETGWRENKKRAWLWTAVTASVVVFLIRWSRGSGSAKELLGEEFKGIVHVDRWGGYNWLPLENKQICWAHLCRDFVKVSERGGPSAKIGNALQEWAAVMFSLWDRVKDGTLKRASFKTYMVEIKREILSILEEGAMCPDKKTAAFCKNIMKIKSALWTFVRVEGVEPTNNTAERAVRKPVLWRKGSYGTDSERGSRFVERVLTTVASLRAQQRNVLDYLAKACSAPNTGDPPPSLLPGSTTC